MLVFLGDSMYLVGQTLHCSRQIPDLLPQFSDLVAITLRVLRELQQSLRQIDNLLPHDLCSLQPRQDFSRFRLKPINLVLSSFHSLPNTIDFCYVCTDLRLEVSRVGIFRIESY